MAQSDRFDEPHLLADLFDNEGLQHVPDVGQERGEFANREPQQPGGEMVRACSRPDSNMTLQLSNMIRHTAQT